MNCPICGHAIPPDNNQDAGAENCPHCGSDLEVFIHIENARKERVSKKKSMAILAALLGIVVVSWGAVSIFSGDKPSREETPSEQVNEDASFKEETKDASSLSSPAVASIPVTTGDNEVLKKENEDLKSEVASLTSEVNKLKEAAPVATIAPSLKITEGYDQRSDKNNSSLQGGGQSKVITHVVKNGESLWKISMKYFNNDTKVKKIAADNNINNPELISTGAKLKIYK